MPKVLYRADGGHPVGTGHILRALRVASCWRNIAPDMSVVLVARDNPATRKFVADAALSNLNAHYLDSAPLEAVPKLRTAGFEHIVRDSAPDIIVVDMLDTPSEDMRRLREMTPVLVSLDDRGEGRLYSDLICSFLVRDPDPSALDASRTWLREGPEYASLPPEFAGVSRGRREPETAVRVLVSLGGADAVGLAVKVAEELLGVEKLSEVEFAIGAAFQKRKELESILEHAPWKAYLRVALPSLLPLYDKADVAIVAGGITMHEAACCGVPAIAVCQPIDHQLMVAGWLEKAGCMLNLGYGDEIEPGRIASAVSALCPDQARRQSMSDSGPRVCDGRGSERTARAILDRWLSSQGG